MPPTAYLVPQTEIITTHSISSKFYIDPNKPPPGVTIEPKFEGKRKVELEGNLLHSRFPKELLCHDCNYLGSSVIEYIPGDFTWLMCCILGFLTLVLMCIPFCINAWKDARHRCPHCQRSVGRYRILGS